MVVNILGEEYEIKILEKRDSCMLENNSDGYVNYDDKCIYLWKDDVWIKHTLIHEMIHAYLFEAGIEFDYGIHNEDNVNFIARMIPKISNQFEKVKGDIK